MDKVSYVIRTCPSKVNGGKSAVGDGSVGESAEAGPSFTASPETDSGKPKEVDDVCPSTSASETAQVTNLNIVIDNNSSANADTPVSKTFVEKDTHGDGINVVQSELLCDGIDMEAEQSDLKSQLKGKTLKTCNMIKQRK